MRQAPAASASLAAARDLLATRLRERSPELEAAVATRAYAIADPHRVADPSYRQRLDAALAVTVEHAISGLEHVARRAQELPGQISAQARLDARLGVPLDTVLRRHFGAEALFGDLLGEEAARAQLPAAALRQVQQEASTRFDRLLAAVGEEYASEVGSRPLGNAERRRETVKRLLAGELVGAEVDIAYDFEGSHLAVMAEGPAAETTLKALAGRCDRRLLVVAHEEEPTCAAWLGGSRPLSSEAAMRELAGIGCQDHVVSIGEPAVGLTGWRFSHLQAKAALPFAREAAGAVRFAEVALEAALRRDELITTSLRRLYLEPLEGFRDGGLAAHQTLRTWFRTERNITATAAALGQDRRTVRNRLRSVEAVIGRPMSEVALDLELALRLDR